jgi:hypothetical protein
VRLFERNISVSLSLVPETTDGVFAKICGHLWTSRTEEENNDQMDDLSDHRRDADWWRNVDRRTYILATYIFRFQVMFPAENLHSNNLFKVKEKRRHSWLRREIHKTFLIG